jgi:hypothetical protein
LPNGLADHATRRPSGESRTSLRLEASEMSSGVISAESAGPATIAPPPPGMLHRPIAKAVGTLTV